MLREKLNKIHSVDRERSLQAGCFLNNMFKSDPLRKGTLVFACETRVPLVGLQSHVE